MKKIILPLLVFITFLLVTCEKENTSTGTFRDSRDDHEYKWVKIGDQIWMAENLAYLPVIDTPGFDQPTEPCYYVYDYFGTSVGEAKAIDNYVTYGVLYNWPAAMNEENSSSTNPSGVQGICPDGWHLPSDDEWTELVDFLGGDSIAGGKLKEAGYEHWLSPNEGATNSSGFTALPGGFEYIHIAGYEHFIHIGYTGCYWSSTKLNNVEAWYRGWLYYDSDNISLNFENTNMGISVRCVKDE